MTISEIIGAGLAVQKQYALVFQSQLAGALSAKWAEYGSTNCVPVPTSLTDGRYMLCADILSEVGPGGLLHAMWAASDHAAIAEGTEVMAWADAVAMIPASESPL